MPGIKLQSSDGEVIEVNIQIAKCSGTIHTMLDCLGMEDEGDEIVNLPNVNSTILRKVIQWATYHKDDLPFSFEDEQKKRTHGISSWDRDFLNVDQETLFGIINAANYLDIKGLYHVSCKKLATMIKGKTTEDIRKTFNVVNDFSPDEEEQIRRENAWLLE